MEYHGSVFCLGGKMACKSIRPTDVEIDQAKKEILIRDIAAAKGKLKDTRVKGFQRIVNCSKLMGAYRELRDEKGTCKYAKLLIRESQEFSSKLEGRSKKELKYINGAYRRAFLALAPYSFFHYLVCMEWNYPPEMKFYANRVCVMKDWAHELENLEFGKYDILGLSGPPRSGKTGIGELFLSWLLGRHPEKSMLFATHTNQMAVKAQQDVLNLITDPRRGWNEIFPHLKIDKSSEYLWINLTPKDQPNNYYTIYFRGIDSSMAGVLEASWLIYCDDLIRGIEEAMNPSRLDNAWVKYSTDISQRRTNSSVKELHIATRWSTSDPLTRIEKDNEGNPRAKFIKVPGLNDKGESNFNFKYNPLDTKHFMKLKELMDDVSFECIIQQNPIDREGLLFPESSLVMYERLPDDIPDRICFSCDVAWGGGDYLSMPIAYVFGRDAYIHDVVHINAPKDVSKPAVIEAIIRNQASGGFFEANNGGDEYAEDIRAGLKKIGYRCNISSGRVPTTRSKLDRIVSCVPEIKGTITDGSGYRLHFKSKHQRDEQYNMFMKHLTSFNQMQKFQGKQKDDAPDALASLITNVLDPRSVGGQLVTLSGNLFGL